MKIYVPRDAAARALGADAVAEAVLREAKARGLDVTLVRNGSRGMVWLEAKRQVVGTVGIDGVAKAFADLANPEVHTKIIVEPWR